MSPRDKKLLEVRLPNDLLGIAADIVRSVEDNSFEAMTVSDDLMQWDNAFAGRYSPTELSFAICYYPQEATSSDREPTWDFLFTLDELRAIVRGEKVSCHLWACEHERCNVFSFLPDYYCPLCDD